MQAADFRTQLLYACATPAVLSVTADAGAVVYYTTDGSMPQTEVVGNTAKIPQGTTTLSISPTSDDSHEVTVKAIAVKNGKSSEVTEKIIRFVKTNNNDQGTKVYLGAVEHDGVGGGPYPIKVKVTTIDGKISRVEDQGTEEGITNEVDHAFWFGYDVMGAQGMPAKLKGKTLEDVIDMKTVPDKEGYDTDAVSGATVWSDGIRYATIAAMARPPIHESAHTVLAPTLTANRSCVPNKQGKVIEVAMAAEAGTTVHYTLDGSTPTQESPVAEDIGFFGEAQGVTLKAQPDVHSEGQIICVRAAAFDDAGKRSDVETFYGVFANTPSTFSYQGGKVTGTAGDVRATMTVESPNMNGCYYLTEIALEGEGVTAEWVKALCSRVYAAQTTTGVLPIEGHEEKSTEILNAIATGLSGLVVAAPPRIMASPDETVVANDCEVTVILESGTKDARIYYTIDGEGKGVLSDPTKVGVPYEGPITVKAENLNGERRYIRAAATTDGVHWSSIVRKDLVFAKDQGADAPNG